jgi:hypothetical protein
MKEEGFGVVTFPSLAAAVVRFYGGKGGDIVVAAWAAVRVERNGGDKATTEQSEMVTKMEGGMPWWLLLGLQ